MLEIDRCSRILNKFANFGAFAIASLCLIFTFVYRNDAFRETARYTLQGGSLIPIFYSILFVPSFWPFRRILQLSPMLWVGRLSYSLYLWHMVVTSVVVKFIFPKTVLTNIAALGLTFAVAALSYYSLEMPLVELRRRLRAGKGRVLWPNRGRSDDVTRPRIKVP
jgi:peptidoglycan/LPS O-acetylase OafA/YrhL